MIVFHSVSYNFRFCSPVPSVVWLQYGGRNQRHLGKQSAASSRWNSVWQYPNTSRTRTRTTSISL